MDGMHSNQPEMPLSPAQSVTGPTRSTTAAVCWIAAAVVWFLAEAVAASAFPHYSYATNYISDLAVPDVEVLSGRAIDSPLHPLVTTAFVVQGLLFALGAVCLTRQARFPQRRIFITLASIHALGMVMIAAIHGGRQNVELGLDTFHMLGAFAAFIAGNLTAVVAGVSALRVGVSRLIGWGSVILGVVGLLGLVMLQVDARTPSMMLLPDGIWERITFYAILIWQAAMGGAMLLRSHGRPLQVLDSGG